MTSVYAQFRAEIAPTLEDAERILITAHYSPDDDSIGSVLSVYQALTDLYPTKSIRIVYTGEPSVRHAVFSCFDKIEWVRDVAEHISEADLCIFLDASQYGRFSKQPELASKAAKSICIDHHGSEPDAFTHILKLPELSSNSEIVYRVFEDQMKTREIAETILLGIVGDTGNFAYVRPDQAEVFGIAQKLLSLVGTSIDAFRARYGGIPKAIIPLLQELVKNTQYGSAAGWPDFQYSYISREVAESGNYSDEDMSAASHIYMGQYLPKVQGYTWGFVITPRTEGCRISGRSAQGSVNIRLVHEGLGVGSGHDRASGGSFSESDPKQCIEMVKEWVSKNSPVLM